MEWPPCVQIKAVSIGQNMDEDIVHRERQVCARFRDVRVRCCAAVDDVNRAGADHMQASVLNYRCRILIDAHPENARIVSNGSQ